MSQIRKQYSADFKAKTAIEVIKEQKTVSEIASLKAVHPTQLKQWKQILIEGAPGLYDNRNALREQDKEKLLSSLFEQIGKQKVEIEFLKKKIGMAESELFSSRDR